LGFSAHYSRVAPSLAADSRRARCHVALHGHQLSLETGLTVREPFPFSPFTFAGFEFSAKNN
jgi:hypothetical protein